MTKTKSFTQAQILGRVNTFLKSETTSKATFGKLSVDIITYVIESNDIPALQRLIDGLSPANYRVAIKFFPQFLGWVWDEDNHRFGKKDKQKTYESKLKKFNKALEENPEWNIWVWYEKSGEKPTPPPKDHKKALTNALKNGLTEEGDNKLSTSDVVQAMYAAGLPLRKVMEGCDALAKLQDLD